MQRLRRAAVTLSIALFLIYGVIVYQVRVSLRSGYSDFVSLYTAGEILKRGTPSHLYDLKLQYEIQKEISPALEIRKSALPFVRPAFEAWIFLPLSYLSYPTAFIVWNLVSCACLIRAVLILRSEIPELQVISRTLLLALSLSYFPVFLTFLQGQDTLLLLLIYTLSYRALRHNHPWTGGMTLGLGIFKFPLLIPFLIPFAVRRNLPVLLGFTLTSIVLAAISVATVGLSTAAYYPHYLLNIDKIAAGVNRPEDMPNIRGLLSTLPGMPSQANLMLLVIFSIVVLAFVLRRSPAENSNSDLSFPMVFALDIVATLLVSYHCHVFDLCLLILPIALTAGVLFSNHSATRYARKYLMWVVAVLLFSPLYLVVMFSASNASLLAILLFVFGAAIWRFLQDTQSSLPA